MITVDEYSSTKVPWHLARYSSTRVLYCKIVLPTQLCCCDRESVDSPPSWNKSQKTRTTLSYMKVQVHVDLSVQSDYRICLYHSDQKLSNMPLIRKYWAKFNTEPQYHVQLAKTCRSCMASGMTIMSIRNQYKIIHCFLLRNQYNNVIFSILYQIMYLRSLAGLYYLSSAQPKRSQNEKCYAGQIRPQKIECEAKIIKRSQSSSTSKLRKNWGQSPKFRFELLIGSRTANVAFKRSQNGS